MPYRLSDLIDVPELQRMLDALYRASGIPSALTDLDGKVVTSSGWRDVCTRFHHACPTARQSCQEGVVEMCRQLGDGVSQVVYQCRNGLVDTAAPIVIDGRHIANAFTGQLFLTAPKPDVFRRQAVEFGFELEPYLEAVARVPVISEEKLRTNLTFLGLFTEMLAEIGLRRLEEREAEERLRHGRKMEVIGRLAGGVAHDFNNLLTGIMGYGSILSSKLPKDSPLQEHARRILEISEDAAGLTRSLLAFSRRQVFELQVIDVNAAVENLRTLLARIIGVDIEFQVSVTATPLCVLADRGQLDQILMNLVTNARDAMPCGGRLRISTTAAALASDSPDARSSGTTDFAQITVEDDGVGMTPEVRERLFEPFFTTKEAGRGTGLGLSMVYGAVKQLNGSITVRSEVDRGSVFTILLPLSRAEPREKPKRSGLPTRGSETVLLAEHAPDVRNMARRLLEEYGYRVIEAADGEQAFTLFQGNADRVALVLLDVVMPRRSGWHAYEAIRALRPQVKVLLTSGHTDELLTFKAIHEKQAHFLPKPYVPFDLLWKVREILDG